jgi:hypothetical protein
MVCPGLLSLPLVNFSAGAGGSARAAAALAAAPRPATPRCRTRARRVRRHPAQTRGAPPLRRPPFGRWALL